MLYGSLIFISFPIFIVASFVVRSILKREVKEERIKQICKEENLTRLQYEQRFTNSSKTSEILGLIALALSLFIGAIIGASMQTRQPANSIITPFFKNEVDIIKSYSMMSLASWRG